MRIIKLGLGVFGVAVAAGVLAFGLLGFGTTSAAPGPGGRDKNGIFAQYQTVLAQKLGITVDALKAAEKATRDQLIDQAVAAGKLTKPQGDALKSGQKPPRGTPGQGGTPGQPGGLRNAMAGLKDLMNQHDTVLAQKLGITVDALKAAEKATRDQLIDQAVAAGKLTKPQGDALKSGQKPAGGPGGPGGAGGRMGPGANVPGGLRSGIGDAMKAAAATLNTTPEELRNALRNGQSLAEFAQSKGIGRDALRASIMASVQNDVNAAIRDGKITAQQGTTIIEGVSKSLDRLLDLKMGRPGQGQGQGRPNQGPPGLQRGPNQR